MKYKLIKELYDCFHSAGAFGTGKKPGGLV